MKKRKLFSRKTKFPTRAMGRTLRSFLSQEKVLSRVRTRMYLDHINKSTINQLEALGKIVLVD
jgi:hypothetical protein